ncbi:hypothetical protein KY285_006388 [Solanum tuberosum]|nr:hypothetical protein KY285_006388 [Solanum tuberosum]
MVDEISSGFVLCDGKHGPISGESSKQVKASVATVGGRRKRSLLSPSCDHLLSQVKTACHPYGSVFFVEWIHLLRKLTNIAEMTTGFYFLEESRNIQDGTEEEVTNLLGKLDGVVINPLMKDTLVWNHSKVVIIPALEWILPGHCRLINSQQPCSFSSILEFYRFLRVGLVQLFYVFWFYPLYIFSLILSNIWYIDIAKYGFFALENYGDHDTKLSDQKEPQTSQNTVHREKPTDLEGVMISIAEQLYSVLLLTFFFMEVYVTGFIPYIGKALNFMLLSWLYAYYCFEYKWNLSGLSLDKRLDFFESNWAFFAGFGTIFLHIDFHSWCMVCFISLCSKI